MNSNDNNFSVENLVEKLQAPGQVVRIYAATVLGSLGEAAAETIPALVHMLETGDVQYRRSAVLALRELGPVAHAASSALLVAAKDEDALVAEMAVQALERMRQKKAA